MYPLLKKDGLSIAYLGCLLLWLAVAPPPAALRLTSALNQQGKQATKQKKNLEQGMSHRARQVFTLMQQLLHWSAMLLLIPAACAHAAQCIIPPPARYLHIYDAAFVTLSFMHIAAVFVCLNVSQWSLDQKQALLSHVEDKQN